MYVLSDVVMIFVCLSVLLFTLQIVLYRGISRSRHPRESVLDDSERLLEGFSEISLQL